MAVESVTRVLAHPIGTKKIQIIFSLSYSFSYDKANEKKIFSSFIVNTFVNTDFSFLLASPWYNCNTRVDYFSAHKNILKQFLQLKY